MGKRIVIPYNKELEFEYGVADQLSPLIRRVIANNPGPFTFHGTGTFITVSYTHLTLPTILRV